MVSIKLLALIILILLLPSQGIAQYGINHVPPGVDYYTFSGQKTGDFPINESMVSFSINGQVSNVSVVKGKYGPGIAIVTYQYSVSSFLDMKFNGSGCTVVQIGFTWNASLGLGDTDIQFPVYYGSTEISEISINSGSNSTVVSELGKNYYLSAEPVMDTYYDLKLYFSQNYGQMFYMELFQNNTSEKVLPVGIEAPLQFAGNLSVMAGGTISEICLYNITDFSGGKGILPEVSSDQNWGNFSAAIPRDLEPSLDRAVAMTYINSLYYVDRNHDLISFNYENNTFAEAAELNLNGSMNVTGVYATGALVVILATGSSGSEIIDYNTTTCLMESYSLRGMTEASGLFIVADSSALVFNSSGDMEWQMLHNASENSGPFSLWNNKDRYAMIEAEVQGTNVYITDLCLANDSLMTSCITSGSSAVSILSRSGFSAYDGIINVSGSTTSSQGLLSILECGIGSNLTSFMMNGSTPEEVGQSSAGLIFSGQFQVFNYGGYCLFLEDSSFVKILIPEFRLSSLWFNSNQTVGTEINATEIALLYQNRSDAFSGDSIFLSLPDQLFIRGNTTLDFHVYSEVSYGVYATIENLTFFSSGESVDINSSLLDNGFYVMQIRALNRAGYNFSGHINCAVDNNKPLIGSQPANNSEIYYGEGIWINATGITGGIEENISSEAFRITSQLSDNRIVVPQFLKAGPIQFDIDITDAYGMAFHSFLSFDLINSSTRNFSANIFNGEYFMTPNIRLSWSGNANISGYTVSVIAGGIEKNYVTNGTGMNLSLRNGNFTIWIIPVLPDGQALSGHEYNVTVMEYGPGLFIETSKMGQYSFFGNSANDTFNAIISSNISSHIIAEIYSPSETPVMNIAGNDSLIVTVGNRSPGFDENGIYTLEYSAVSLSGSSTSGEILFMVNNTIPVIQGKPGYTYYTNSTRINTGIDISPGDTSYYSLNIDDLDTGYVKLVNGTVNLSHGQGLYNISLKEISSSGNTAYLNFTAIYSCSAPEIDISVSGTQLRYLDYTVVHYAVKDSVPVCSMTLEAGNMTHSVSDPEAAGNMMVVFRSDGLFNITVFAVDECANSNHSVAIACNVTYFVSLNSTSMDANVFGQHGAFSLIMKGSELQNVNESWYVNGAFIGTGSSGSYNLPLGYSNVTCVLQYDGHETILTRHVFVAGFYPELSAVAAVLSMIGYIYLKSLTKGDEAKDFIIKNSGKEISYILKLGKKIGIPKASIARQIRILARRREIRKDSDLSGNVYVFASDQEKR
jgi:hypothetical protein